MRRTVTGYAACLAALALLADAALAGGQMGGGMGGMGGPGARPGQNAGSEIPPSPRVDKPDAVADKAFKYGIKALNKAKEYAATAAANSQNPDKKAAALEKESDSYTRALDAFTEVLRNKGDMVEAWNYVGFVHLQLGAYAEAVDDYNHTLQLQPELLPAIEGRAEAYMAVDRLDDAKSSYMDLFTHDPKLADQLMAVMQQWVVAHRADANGMRASAIDSFGKWVEERDGIAKQAATLPP
jgi:tetratricopeptide (TPR) repeat protein